MLMAHRSGDVRFIAKNTGAVLAQPITGYLPMREAGQNLSDLWIATALGLYALAGAFWLPVVWIQARMRDLAIVADATTSLLDIAIGGAIAIRQFCRSGLLAEIAVSLSYLASATFLTPALWADPLGSLVKIAPAVMLMLVTMAILEDR